MYNEVTLIGTALNDPTTWKLKNGASVSRFFLATSEQYKDKTGEWQQRDQVHNCAGWNVMSTSVQNKVRKKTLLLVRGKVIYSKAKKDGIEYDRAEIEISYIRPVVRPDGPDRSERPTDRNKRATRRADGQQAERKAYSAGKSQTARVDLATGEVLAVDPPDTGLLFDDGPEIFDSNEPIKPYYNTSEDVDGCDDMPF